MAKKTKRSVSTGTASSYSPEARSTPVVAPARTSPVAAAPRASYTQEFKPDYTYVVRDLKQIAALAGVFVVVLVALSFILR